MINVKVCGITNVADALQAAQVGVTYLGYILHAQTSPRQISPITAALIIAAVRRQYPTVKHVGVFVDAPAATINQITEQAGLDVVQLHGQESPELIQQLIAPFVWKAIVTNESDTLRQLIEQYQNKVDGLLFDAGQGSGQPLHSSILAALSTIPFANTTTILAGGIGPDTISHLLSRFRPTIVDLNSGVERAPGHKDMIKLAAVMQQLL